MMTVQNVMDEINGFIENWDDNSQQAKTAFIRLKNHLEKKEGVSFAFKGRAGVSYSLRAKHENQKARELFVMVDVIDDDPENRWLSVCFYGDMLTDPDEMGDLIPEGLMGDDGYCFDLEEADENELKYVEARLDEAALTASK